MQRLLIVSCIISFSSSVLLNNAWLSFSTAIFLTAYFAELYLNVENEYKARLNALEMKLNKHMMETGFKL